ncbi:hypothetical protein Nepgr_028533 [Nepenthes gracilis]|uniref:Uncharacterized protein n=1 Tax=Nepenthes gracilis TaxID=150966 RepID=A0AAD3TAI5_NEPGR|nr:hypothetical protein Nepgr_028533 [Nepenthes gracilis]
MRAQQSPSLRLLCTSNERQQQAAPPVTIPLCHQKGWRNEEEAAKGTKAKIIRPASSAFWRTSQWALRESSPAESPERRNLRYSRAEDHHAVQERASRVTESTSGGGRPFRTARGQDGVEEFP